MVTANIGLALSLCGWIALAIVAVSIAVLRSTKKKESKRRVHPYWSDLSDHYKDLKSESFFDSLLEEIEKYYQTDRFASEAVSSAAGAIGFVYVDDQLLLEHSMPDKVLHIVVICYFLMQHDLSDDLLTDEMKADLELIIRKKLVRRYKRYYYPADYEKMKDTIHRIPDWLKQAEG